MTNIVVKYYEPMTNTICVFILLHLIIIILYRASTITGHTVYFTKRTGHLKMRYSQFFSLSEHNKHTKLHSQYRKNLRKSFFKCPVRFVKYTVCPVMVDTLYIRNEQMYIASAKLNNATTCLGFFSMQKFREKIYNQYFAERSRETT